MTEIILFALIFVIMASVMGYLIGCGCQRHEDLNEIRRIKKGVKKALEKAYLKGREDQREDSFRVAEEEIRTFYDDLFTDQEEIKFGGF